MIPPVPALLRFGIGLALKVVAFVVEVAAILLNGLANWIAPELDREAVEGEGPKP